jgi:uncharacterized protein YjiS (DUF1127 family)
MSVHHPPEWLRSQDRSATLTEHLRLKAGPLARLAHATAAYSRRRREQRALDAMSDAELRDIGVTWGSVHPVFYRDAARELAMPGAVLQERR